MAQLIDTSVFIDGERRGYSAEALSAAVLADSAFLSAITASELLVGIHRSVSSPHWSQRQAFVEGILDRIRVIPFDLDIARIHAQLTAELMSTGQVIGAHDLLIAATAVARGYAILRHNVIDFERVPGLVVERPRW